MNVSVHQRIRDLIEETNTAFGECRGSVNTDFAEFATLSLSEFKSVLRDPKLTKTQLCQMLRKGMLRTREHEPDRWSHFMAKYIASAANNAGTKRSARSSPIVEFLKGTEENA